MEKVLYSDMGKSILELMDNQCVADDNSCSIDDYDKSIAECSAMLTHYLDIGKVEPEGTFRYNDAKDEVAFWSRMLKTAKYERRRFLTA